MISFQISVSPPEENKKNDRRVGAKLAAAVVESFDTDITLTWSRDRKSGRRYCQEYRQRQDHAR